MTVTTDQVIAEARSWVGVPYRHQGRTRQGIDCIGLIVVVAQALQLFPPHVHPPANYTRRPKDGLLEREVAANCVAIAAIEPGCLVLMSWNQRAPPSHCGIITGETIVHAYGGNEKVVEHGFRAKWPARARSFWRLPNVEARK